MTTTATDCWTSFAPYLANVVCCPQFDAMLVTLIGQSSKYSGVLALNTTHASHCLSDVQKVLVSQGANENLKEICSVHPTNLTEASCPVVSVDEFESVVDTSRLLTACRKIDPVNECCDQVCQNVIHYAARKIALNDLSTSDGNHSLPGPKARINDCKNIVVRWLASKLDPSTANSVFRGLSNCNLNKGEHGEKNKNGLLIFDYYSFWLFYWNVKAYILQCSMLLYYITQYAHWFFQVSQVL